MRKNRARLHSGSSLTNRSIHDATIFRLTATITESFMYVHYALHYSFTTQHAKKNNNNQIRSDLSNVDFTTFSYNVVFSVIVGDVLSQSSDDDHAQNS